MKTTYKLFGPLSSFGMQKPSVYRPIFVIASKVDNDVNFTIKILLTGDKFNIAA